MNIEVIEPAVQAITEQDPFKRVELAGRICYASEDKIKEGSADRFVSMLLNNGHLTPFEAVRLKSVDGALTTSFRAIAEEVRRGAGTPSTGLLRSWIADFNMDPDFATFKIVCDRGIGNELVRHRALSFLDTNLEYSCAPKKVLEMSMVQSSTRYINYGAKPYSIVRPVPATWAAHEDSEEYKVWYDSCTSSYSRYLDMLKLDIQPQYARNALPLSTATTIVMSGTAEQWAHFLKLRLAKDAHPQMRWIAMLLVGAQEMQRLMDNMRFHLYMDIDSCAEIYTTIRKELYND